jgi:20S proteasome subunit alpha 3
MDVKACLRLAVKVLSRTMDSTAPTADKMELTTITRSNGKVIYNVLNEAETTAVIASVQAEISAAGDM